MSKLWGGRFEGELDRAVLEFTTSIGVDARLWDVDIRCSIAHAQMLGRQAILPQEEAKTLVCGLEALRLDLATQIAQGVNPFRADAEDVHSEIERMLSERLGAVAGKLHTARSRNDQVVTDTRLYLREALDELSGDLRALQSILCRTAEEHLETVLPGLTHMQHAQPVSLAHHLMAYFWMLERDRGRLRDCRNRTNFLPLGSAALAGTSFALDRQFVAASLGFSQVSENSLDAVSDRDFCVEFLSAGATLMIHLSRLADELVLWSMPEFGFLELSDGVTTGSSIMPQKKNPDVAELIRGRAGRLNGALMALLTTLKALPLSYNRDLQEDKVHLFEGLDTVRSCVKLMARILQDAQFRPGPMADALRGDFSNATDLADYLVTQGVPFRQCHEIVGRMVRYCLENHLALEQMSLAEMQNFSPLFQEPVLSWVQHTAVMRARNSEGGTGPQAVKVQIQKAQRALGGEV